MQALCYSTGLTPAEFWECTMDEAVLVVKGSSRRLADFRKGFDLIHKSLVGKDAVDITQWMPLPFDGAEQVEDLESEYKRLGGGR